MGTNESLGQAPRRPFTVTLNDDTMLPRYRAGTALRVDPSKSVAVGDEACVAIGTRGELVIGLLLAKTGAGVTLRQYGGDSKLEILAPVWVCRIDQIDEFLF